MRREGFTLIELLVVILVLAVLMAIAIPLYMKAVRDSQRQTCRSNMQVIAHAEQAYKVRSQGHVYTNDLTQLVGTSEDLQSVPQCPGDSVRGDTDDYTVTINANDSITIRCNADDAANATYHNTVGSDTNHGFTPGADTE